MPTCVNCGRPLPPDAFGEAQQLCQQCREQILAHTTQRSAQQEATRRPAPAFPITSALVGINVLVYVAMALSGSSPLSPDTEHLVRWGANHGRETLTTQPWRLLTATFLHGGLLHIATNMWCLWNLGRMAENIFGRFTFLLVYLFTGISASLLSVSLHPGRVSAALNSLLIFTVVNLAIGASVPVIDNTGHIGGLILGLLIGALLAPGLTRDQQSKARHRQLVFSGLAVLLAVAILFARQAG